MLNHYSISNFIFRIQEPGKNRLLCGTLYQNVCFIFMYKINERTEHRKTFNALL